MKTNNIPALITLSAGAIYCIIGLSNHYEAMTFVRELLIVLIIFFVLGSLVKTILDKSFKDFGDKAKKEEEEKPKEESSDKEDISAGESSDDFFSDDE